MSSSNNRFSGASCYSSVRAGINIYNFWHWKIILPAGKELAVTSRSWMTVWQMHIDLQTSAWFGTWTCLRISGLVQGSQTNHHPVKIKNLKWKLVKNETNPEHPNDDPPDSNWRKLPKPPKIDKLSDIYEKQCIFFGLWCSLVEATLVASWTNTSTGVTVVVG